MASSKKRWGDHRCGVSVNARKSHFVCVCFGTLPSVWTLSSQTRDLTQAKAVKVSSPNHRPTRFLQRICFDAQQAGRPGAGFCPVPVLGPDQQGAPEANEWQAGEGAQDPPPPPIQKAGFIHPPGPQAIEDLSLPSQRPPSQVSRLPWSPERQSLKGTQKSGLLFSDQPCSWDTQVGAAGGQAKAPRQGTGRRGWL